MPLVGMPPFLLMGFVGAVIDRPFFRSRHVQMTPETRGRPVVAPTIGGTLSEADKRKIRQGGRQDTGRPFGNIVPENTGKKVDGKCV